MPGCRGSEGRAPPTVRASSARASRREVVLIGWSGVSATGSEPKGGTLTVDFSVMTNRSSFSPTVALKSPARSTLLGSSSGGSGAPYIANQLLPTLKSEPSAMVPRSSVLRDSTRARGLALCQSSRTWASSTMNTLRVSAQESKGFSSLSKCSHQNCLASRRW